MLADKEQETMSAAGLTSIGGSGTVGHGVMERVLRIVPGARQPSLHLLLLPSGRAAF